MVTKIKAILKEIEKPKAPKQHRLVITYGPEEEEEWKKAKALSMTARKRGLRRELLTQFYRKPLIWSSFRKEKHHAG
jgi:hypothetical protein